jgi:hypothetical protein
MPSGVILTDDLVGFLMRGLPIGRVVEENKAGGVGMKCNVFGARFTAVVQFVE